MNLRRALGYLCLTTGFLGLIVLVGLMISPSVSGPTDADQMLALGENRLRGGDFSGAHEWFTKAAEAEPDRIEPLIASAKVLELKGESDKAIKVYRKLLDRNPSKLEPALVLAKALDKAGRPREAENLLVKTCHVHQKSPEPRELLASIRLNSGDRDGARKTYNDLMKLRPNEAKGILGIALVEEMEENLNGAAEAYEKATQIEKQSAFAWEGLGRISVVQGDIEKAEKAYKKVTELRKQDYGALTVLATIVEKQGRYEESAKIFQKAIDGMSDASGELLKTRALALTGLGTCMLAMGHTDKAYKALAGALTDDPDQPEALWALSPIYIQRKQYKSARDSLERMMSIRGEEPVFWVMYGRAQAGLGDWVDAKVSFERSLQLDESQIDGRKWWGISLRVLGAYHASSLALLTVLEGRPSDGLARLNYAIALGQLGEIERARGEFEKTRQLMVNRPEPYYFEAHLLLSAGNTAQALELAEQAVSIDNEDRGALEVLARCLDASGKNKRAREISKRALSLSRGGQEREYLEQLSKKLSSSGTDG